MEFVCNKVEMSEAVANVSKAVSARPVFLHLEGIKFSLKGENLELTGYDMEFGIRTVIKVKSNDSGEFIADAKYFSEMIRKMPDGDITVNLDPDTYRVTIESGLTSYTLNAFSSSEYPELPEKDSDEEIKLSQPVLKSMIVQTKFAAAMDDLKPILKGILFEIEDNVIQAAAIDGFRLAVRKEAISYSGSQKFIVPAKNMDEISKLLSDDENESCSIFLSKKHIIIEIGNYLVNSRLLEGEFHPYRSSIPKNIVTEAVVDRNELINTLERCTLLVNEKNPNPVKCRFEGGNIKIKCENSLLGKINDEIGVKMTGDPMTIGFKCKFFLDPLKVITDDKVKLQLTGSLQPMKVIPVDGDDYLYLVLPVRLPRE